MYGAEWAPTHPPSQHPGRRNSSGAKAPTAGHAGLAGTDVDTVSGILGDQGKERAAWIRQARLITYLSITATLVGGFTGIAAAVILDSASVLGYALESFVDVWSSVLVLWRFQDDCASLEAVRLREQQASFGISLTFVGIAIVVGRDALRHLWLHQAPEQGAALCVIAAASMVMLTGLALAKWQLAVRLESASLRKDALTSAVVALLSAAILASAQLYSANAALWWFDSAVALALAAVLGGLGVGALLGTPWWTAAFWAAQPPVKRGTALMSVAV